MPKIYKINLMDENNTTNNKKEIRAYVPGLILAVLLTIVSFYLIYSEKFSAKTIFTGLIISAFAQIIVHLRFFLHLDLKQKNRWNLYVLLFTAILIFIFIGGSIWVMSTLNLRMM